MIHRLLLRAYPSWFRREFAAELILHLRHQRAEARYNARGWGVARFVWDAGIDALATGLSLRLGRARERVVGVLGRWRGSTGSNGPARHPGMRGPRRGRTAALLDGTAKDVRHAFRGLARNPGYAFVFIVTLGLGIGANTAMFSVVHGVLLRPLPHENGDRLVYLRQSARAAGIGNVLFSVPEIDDYRRQTPSLEAVAEFSALDFTMLGFDTPLRVRAGIVTGNYFEVMGLSSIAGRTVGPDDDGAAAPAVIVLSAAYWRSAFGSDPDIVGQTVEINGRTATVVGVAEPAPPYPERTDIYVNLATSPHHLDATMSHDRIHRMTEVFARLAPGSSVESAQSEVAAVSARIHGEYPEAYDEGSRYDVSVTPLKAQLTSRARPTLLLLLGTAFFVLVIACANLANLTLTRVLRRDRELAVRASLGATKGALRRELLAESLLLALIGAGVGLLLASVSLDLLVGFTERFTSRASEISLDAPVFGVALAAALAASMFFTLLPALPGGDRVGSALARNGGRSTVGTASRRAQRALVVAQIGTSFVLLIGAGLLLRTLIHLQRIDPGFDTVQVVGMDVPPNTTGRTDAEVRDQYTALLADLREIQGVEDAALTSAVPLAGASTFSPRLEIGVEGHEPVEGGPTPRADFRVVSPGYFRTMGIDLLRGRDFATTDLDDAQEVVIINESMARAYFGDRNPLGQRIAWTDDVMKFMGEGQDGRTVVGVVADTRDAGLDADVVHVVYNPYAQITPQFTGSLVVRVNGEPSAILPPLRVALRAYDSNQVIENVATVAEMGNESVATRRLNAILLSAFAALALVISAVGIGGVLAFSVGSRTREFGIRSALGAARHQVWSGVVVEGAAMAGMGVVLGGVLAVVLSRFIAGLLVGVPTLDPVTFLVVGLLLGGVAVVASWAPAWRAARVSPSEALVSE